MVCGKNKSCVVPCSDIICGVKSKRGSCFILFCRNHAFDIGTRMAQ